MFRTGLFSAERPGVRVRATSSLRFAAQGSFPGSCRFKDGREPRLLPQLGLASSVGLELAAIPRRRLFLPHDWAVSLIISNDLDFGRVVATLIVVVGLIPLATAGLWEWR